MTCEQGRGHALKLRSNVNWPVRIVKMNLSLVEDSWWCLDVNWVPMEMTGIPMPQRISLVSISFGWS